MGQHEERNPPHSFLGEFHLEGLGAAEFQVAYTVAPVMLDPTNDTYETTYTVTALANTLPKGLYRCVVIVIDQNWAGAAGFNEGLVFQIY